MGIEFTLTPIFHVGQHPMTTRSRLLRLLDGAASRFAGAPRPSPGALDPFAGILPWELTSRASLEVPHCERGGGIETGVSVNSIPIDTPTVNSLPHFSELIH